MSVACGIQCHFGKGKASCMGESHVPLSLGLFETRLRCVFGQFGNVKLDC